MITVDKSLSDRYLVVFIIPVELALVRLVSHLHCGRQKGTFGVVVGERLQRMRLPVRVRAQGHPAVRRHVVRLHGVLIHVDSLQLLAVGVVRGVGVVRQRLVKIIFGAVDVVVRATRGERHVGQTATQRVELGLFRLMNQRFLQRLER